MNEHDRLTSRRVGPLDLPLFVLRDGRHQILVSLDFELGSSPRPNASGIAAVRTARPPRERSISHADRGSQPR